MVKGNWAAQLKKGSIQICVMSLLSRSEMYGYEIIKTLQQESGGYFDLKEGTLYPILYRLEERKYVKSHWLQKDKSKPPRNYYSITNAGKKALKEAVQEFHNMVDSTEQILKIKKKK
jgi:PadR family transcriptional regulator PadR